MTDEAVVDAIRPIVEVFRRDCTAFWATTFNVGLAFFNGYLVGRLGDPPLNAVVIADQDRLDSELQQVPAERVHTLQAVNTRWLLRGARFGTGRFHPKSYLAVRARAATLLVGSGNLSRNGVDVGREVFTAFESGTPDGDAALRVWRAWMRRVVEGCDDTQLLARFVDLEQRLDTLPKAPLAAAAPDAVWHNFDTPLLDQFCDAVLAALAGTRVDELSVTAPFYDETGDALGRLIERLAPSRLRVYWSSATKVDGPALVNRLKAVAADVSVFGYVPDRFTHAKLVGAVAGTRGWMLSGSANLSRAALTLTVGAGNVELAVFSAPGAAAVVAAMVPPGVDIEERDLAALTVLEYDPDPEDAELAALPVRLHTATLRDDGSVEVVAEPAIAEGWHLGGLSGAAVALMAAGNTVVTAGEFAERLVHVVAADGAVLSNRVVVTDPKALARALQVTEPSQSAKPIELTAADLDSPLGQALLFLHQRAVMDVHEALAAAPGAGMGQSDVGPTEDADDLWTRLEKETLGRDPRVGVYGRLFGEAADGGAGFVSEPLEELLDTMRDRAPAAGETRARSFLGDVARNAGTGHAWSPSARIRLRARNVLTRWARAQVDRRLAWADPLAPLGNLALVAAMFVTLWQANAEEDTVIELEPDDLDELWEIWLRPFVGTGVGDGWFDTIDRTDPRVLDAFAGDLGANVTALTWLAITGPDRRERVVAWQPYLRAAFAHGLIAGADEDMVEFLGASGYDIDADRIDRDLLEALDFIDDPMWCEQAAAQFGFDSVRLELPAAGQTTSLRLDVRGVEHPLYDPRVPALVVSVRAYRSVDAVAIFGPDRDWRVVVATGEQVLFKAGLDAPLIESDTALDAGELDAIVAAHGVLGELFSADLRVA